MKSGSEQHTLVSESSAAGRRSTRLPISLPIVISGKDAQQNEFRENTHTLVVNKHGAKIAAAHQLAVNTEVLIENLPLKKVARANVVWFNPDQGSDKLHEAGVQLVDAENIWGIEFPPKDWESDLTDHPLAVSSAVPGSAPSLVPSAPPAIPKPLSKAVAPPKPAGFLSKKAVPPASPPSGDLTGAQLRTFEARLEKLAEQIRTQLETDLRKQVSSAREQDAAAVERELQASKEQLNTLKAEWERLEAKFLDLERSQQAAVVNTPPPLPPELLEEKITTAADPLVRQLIETMVSAAREQFLAQIRAESDRSLASWKDRLKTNWDSLSEMARQQLTAAVNSVVGSMNRETEAGLQQLKGHVQKEIQTQTKEALNAMGLKLQEMQERAVSDAAEAFRARFSEVLALLQPGGKK